LSEIVFTVGDMTDVRFCTSPLWETVFSVRAMADAGHFPALGPWLRQTRVAVAGRPDVASHLAYLSEFVRAGSWIPDFLTPPPPDRGVELADELAQMMATPLDRVRSDILACARWKPITATACAAAAQPEGAKGRLRDAIVAWHEVAIAPNWARMQALHDADIAYRTRQLSRGGLRLLFSTLHPTVRWAGDRLIADDPWNLSLSVAGRGLPLMPGVFVGRKVLWNVTDAAPPLAVYPVRAVGTLWSDASTSSGTLARVFGAGRAQVLTLLRAPATTTDIARRTGLSAGAVSQHLSALHGAGIVERARHGREVYYEATAVGTELLRVNGVLAGP
jgi:DNA-binding transcriptional ArsR family regulator